MAKNPGKKTAAAKPAASSYTFLTNHSHVLICLTADPKLTLREVAVRVGITERAVIAIVRDLAESKVLTITRQGRRNAYKVNPHVHLRHPVEAHKTVGDLLKTILD